METWTPTKRIEFCKQARERNHFPHSAQLLRGRQSPKDAPSVEAEAAAKTAETWSHLARGPHLDAQNVRASSDELVGQFQVVLQGVLLPARVRDVARVGDGGLHDAPCRPGRLHAQQHVGEVVQGVEHTEDVHAVLLGHLTEPGGGRLNGEEKEIHISI